MEKNFFSTITIVFDAKMIFSSWMCILSTNESEVVFGAILIIINGVTDQRTYSVKISVCIILIWWYNTSRHNKHDILERAKHIHVETLVMAVTRVSFCLIVVAYSVDYLTNIVGNYTCYDRHNKRANHIHNHLHSVARLRCDNQTILPH